MTTITAPVNLSGLIASLQRDVRELRQQHTNLTLAITVLERELAVALDGWRDALAGASWDLRARQEHAIMECRSHVDAAIDLARPR